jgi:hypothetical protein
MACASIESMSVRYCGTAEAAALRSALIGAAPESVLTFALTPGQIGANRNLGLLLAAGRRCLFVDDDILFDTWTSDAASSTVRVVGHGEFRQWQFFDSRVAALAGLKRVACDLIAEHERFIGRSLADVVAEASDAAHACSHIIAGCEEPGAGRVVMTSAGIAGDTARYCPDQILLLSGTANAAICADRRQYELALTHREVRRISECPTVTHDATCATYCAGVDNSAPLVPFPPVGRNEDGVFGTLLSWVVRGAAFVHIPFGVVHDSERSSAYSLEEQCRSARETRISDYLTAAVGMTTDFPIVEARARVALVAATCESLSRLSTSDFTATLREALTALRCAHFQAADIESERAPSWFKDALRAYRTKTMTNAREPDFFAPADLDDLSAPAKRFEAARAYVGLMGETLQAWSAIWSTASRLHL